MLLSLIKNIVWVKIRILTTQKQVKLQNRCKQIYKQMNNTTEYLMM